MSLFSNRQLVGRWAARLLFVWLFGLAVGVAHACTLGEAAHGNSAPAEVAGVAAAHLLADHDAARGTCTDFCEKSSLAATPKPKLTTDDDGGVGPLLPALAPERATSALSRPLSSRWLPTAPPHLPGGIPLRIAYRRLAL